MHKNQKLVLAATVAMAIIIALGFVALIFSPKGPIDTAYDVAILAVSGLSIIIALYSQNQAFKESRRVDKMVRHIDEVRKNVGNDVMIDKSVRYKLDKIIAIDEQIYRKIGGRKKISALVKESTQKGNKLSETQKITQRRGEK